MLNNRNHWIAVIDETGTTSSPSREDEGDFAFGCILVRSECATSLAGLGTALKKLTNKGDPKYSDVLASSEASRHFIELMRSKTLAPRATGLYVAGAGTVREAGRRHRMASRTDGAQLLGTYARLSRTLERGPRERLTAAVEALIARLGILSKLWDDRITVYFDRRSDSDHITRAADDLRKQFGNDPDIGDVVGRLEVPDRLPTELTGLIRLADVIAGDVRELFLTRGPGIWDCLDARGLQLGIDEWRSHGQSLSPASLPCLRATRAERLVPPRSRCMLQSYHRSLADRVLSFISPAGIQGELQVEAGHRWRVFQVPEMDYRGPS